MQPTATEKLILQMLCDIHKKLDITDNYDPDLIARAVSSNDYWVLDFAYDLKDEGAITPPHVTAVLNALDMYSFLKESFERLSAGERAAVIGAVPRAETATEFPGFDGNNEARYRAAARYLVNDLERFNSMKAVADRNSHTRMANIYSRQYQVFEPIRATLINRTMSVDQIIAVLQA